MWCTKAWQPWFKLANMVDKVGVETMSYTTPIFHIALMDAYGGVAFYRMVLYMALYILCLRLRWSFMSSFRIKVFLQTGHKQGLFSWRWTVEKCLLAFRNPEKLLPHRLHWPPPSGSLRTPPSGIWPSATGNGNTCVNFQYLPNPESVNREIRHWGFLDWGSIAMIS